MHPALVNIDSLVQEAYGLDPLSACGARLEAAMSQEGWTPKELVVIIETDPELRDRVLDWANQSTSGSQRKVHSIEGALIRVGPGLALGLAIGTSVREWMQRELLEYGLQEGELWRHSVAAAVAVDQGRKFCRVPMAPEAFCAALLHDTGKFVLASHLGQQGAESLQRTGEHQDLSDEQAERKVLQICHTELGARLAKGWRLREGTADGIQYHHAPLLGPTPQARRLGTQVALGDAVARAIGLDCGTGSGASFNPAIAGALGITSEGFDWLCAEVERRVEDGLELLAA